MALPELAPPQPSPRTRWARVGRLVIGVLALVGAVVVALTALAALGLYVVFGKSLRHDAEENVAAFAEAAAALPHVREVDSIELGVADIMLPVRDTFARVVLDDDATIDTLRQTADRLRPWTLGSELDDRVHPEIDLDGYSMTVSPSAAVTETRIDLLVRARKDPALRGAAFTATQLGDEYTLDDSNASLTVGLVVADVADVADTLLRWEEIVAPVGALEVTVTVGEIEGFDPNWPERGERGIVSHQGETVDPAVLAAVTAVMADPAVTAVGAWLGSSSSSEVPIVDVHARVDDVDDVQRLLGEVAAMPGSAAFTELVVTTPQSR